MYISGIEKFSDANGDGFRTVVYVSGCSHHCKNCQNPETWDYQNGALFDDGKMEEIISSLKNKNISGLTLSGGDPLNEHNIDEIFNLIKRVNDECPNKTIWIYSGYYFKDLIESKSKEDEKRMDIIKLCDVMVDGLYVDKLKDIKLRWKGSSNQSVIDVQKSLEKGEVVLWNI